MISESVCSLPSLMPHRNDTSISCKKRFGDLLSRGSRIFCVARLLIPFPFFEICTT